MPEPERPKEEIIRDAREAAESDFAFITKSAWQNDGVWTTAYAGRIVELAAEKLGREVRL